MKTDRYYYIGKDGKTVLARDLEDQRDALASENAVLRAKLALRNGECEAKAAIIAQLEAQLATARDGALEEAMDVLNRNHGVPCTPVYPATWSHERLEAYQAGQMDAASSWKAQIRAMKGSTP